MIQVLRRQINKNLCNATFLNLAQKFEAFSLGGLTYHLLLPLSKAVTHWAQDLRAIAYLARSLTK